MNVSHVNGCVALVTSNAAANSHAKALTDIFLNGNGPLGQLRPFQPQSTFQERGHTLTVSKIWYLFTYKVKCVLKVIVVVGTLYIYCIL